MRDAANTWSWEADKHKPGRMTHEFPPRVGLSGPVLGQLEHMRAQKRLQAPSVRLTYNARAPCANSSMRMRTKRVMSDANRTRGHPECLTAMNRWSLLRELFDSHTLPQCGPRGFQASGIWGFRT